MVSGGVSLTAGSKSRGYGERSPLAVSRGLQTRGAEPGAFLHVVKTSYSDSFIELEDRIGILACHVFFLIWPDGAVAFFLSQAYACFAVLLFCKSD